MPLGMLETIVVNGAWCKGCGICVAFCPKDVLVMNDDGKAAVADGAACTVCELCERLCPDLALEVVRRKEVAE
jgi:2-oxoglutarate ferredoxin oxidoreductase subunit delta